MPTQPSAVLRFSAFFAFLLLAVSGAFAQNPAPESRITQAVDSGNLTLLKGNVYSLARPEFDRGVAPSSLPMERMTLVLRPSPEQAAALARLLDEQQDQSSPNYHKWLTPVQFGQQFGASEQDIQAITSWLQSQGFQVNHVANGRNLIEFSGTAGQVQEAFHTAIHKYSVPTATGNEEHWANAADPQIPTALASVVVGVATLHNFLKAPQHILSTQKFPFSRKPGLAPEFTGVNGNHQPVHAVTPGDLAIIYNANPLYAASPAINGTGSTNAVVARSNVIPQDVIDFRNNFGIFGPVPQIVLNGRDPGDLGGGEEVEAVLDISYSGALAPQSTVKFVVSATTNTADGVNLSEMFIIDQNLGDVMTESFGGCEEGATTAEAAGISNLAQQAAAQGITYLVSTGDSGSAGCDNPSSPAATHGVSVNILASTPYTVGVGGTMFNEGANAATYWNATNTAFLASAISYIPENAWNESCSGSACGSAAPNLAAGGGGVSILFPKPSWQSGVAGIPSTGDRNLPDVSLTAAGHDAYLICLEGSCQRGEFEGVAGTSASVQAFGGIMALVRQKIGARVGQADYVFYKLAATETLANCNGSKATPVPSTNCIFYDTTVGNNAVPGITNGDYPTTVGYDRATGLGSVNITNLVNQWSTATFAPSVTTLTVTPTSFTHGAAATFNITVAPQTGTPSFNNELASLLSSTGADIDDPLLSSTGTASGTANNIPGGSTTLTAHYPGNGTLGSSDSAPVSVTVAAEQSTTTLALTNGSGVAFTGGTFGSPIALATTTAGKSGFGVPTGLLTVNDSAQGQVFLTDVDGSGNTSLATGSYFPMVGTHSVTANYQGDPSFLPSTSTATTFQITQAPTTLSLQASQSTIAPGANVTITATLVEPTADEAPSGMITFFAGSASIGTAFPAGPNSDATASITTNALPTGVNSITAKYAGVTDYAPSTAPAITINVTLQPDFAVSASPSPISVTSPGQSATTTVTIAGSNGFSGVTSFACSGLPSESACVFSTPTVTGSGTTILTVTTTAPSSVVPSGDDFKNWHMTGNSLRVVIFCVGLLLLSVQLRRRRLNLVGGGVVMLATLIGLGACGGGSSHVTTPPPNPGTPMVQNQIITVTATSAATTTTAAITHTTTFALNVN
jgi:Pro-kumamolisin, activation domain/Bacterial Ig-like domain (group 3)